MHDDMRQNTIAILYPGEMGSTLGTVLLEAGFRVTTITQGRSPRTERLCRESGMTVVESLDDLLRQADIVISLVPPGAALSVALDVVKHMSRYPQRLTYVDANSISPMTVAQIAEALHGRPIDFLDAAIFGLAGQLRQRGSFYLSGPRANDLADQFRPLLRVKVLGDEPGQASALKMIVSAIPKGLSALFMESLLLAHDMHLLNEALEACDEIYPSIMEIIRRMLPTYPQHAARRCEELREVEETMFMNGIYPGIVHAVRGVTSAVAQIDWRNNDTQLLSLPDIIMQIHSQGMLEVAHTHIDEPLDERRRLHI